MIDPKAAPSFHAAFPSPVTPASAVSAALAAPSPQARAQLIASLSALLEALIAHTDPSIPLLPPPSPPFSPSLDPRSPLAAFYSSSKTQPFSLHFYLTYLADIIPCSDAAFVVALAYIVRVGRKEPLMRVSSWSVHRLFLTALVLACKFVDDAVCTNEDFAFAGGLDGFREMNKLENVFLDKINFELAVDLQTYDHYRRIIEDGQYRRATAALSTSSSEDMLVETAAAAASDKSIKNRALDAGSAPGSPESRGADGPATTTSIMFDLYSPRGITC